MDPLAIITKYYTPGSKAYQILVDHSRLVADKAVEIARNKPHLNIDVAFVEEAAMVHDIGMFLCDAPEIACYGTAPYICHGYLGADLMRKEGFPRHALVCERHTGTGITLEMILRRDLPIPHRDMLPVSIEEQLVCFADKFFSKSKPYKEKQVKKVRRKLEKYGEEGILQFDKWCKLFLED